MANYTRLFHKTIIEDKIKHVFDVARAVNPNIDSLKITSLTKLKIIQDCKKSSSNKCEENCKEFTSGILSLKNSNSNSTSLHYYGCKHCKNKYFDQDYVLKLIDDASKELAK